MRKIPTLFLRDPNDRKRVLPEVTPGCEWVLAGEGTATRKYDGTCVMIANDGTVWARREVKPGKQPPPGFAEVEHDAATGKTVGWEPAAQSAFAKLIDQAWTGDEPVGTYELCGPKVNGNPEGFDRHRLIPHGAAVLADVADLPFPVNAEFFYGWCNAALLSLPYEGIVWHHPDGRMAKLKRRDFA